MKLVVAAIITASVLASCKKDQRDDTPPQLDIPFISTDDVDRFTPFGYTSAEGFTNAGYEVTFNNTNAYITAACNGSISTITPEANGAGMHVEVALGSRSSYMVHYRHLDRLLIQTGQIVEAGDTLGRPDDASPLQFQVQNTRYGFFVCPRFYGNSSFNLAFDRALAIQNANYGTTYTTTCIQEKVQ